MKEAILDIKSLSPKGSGVGTHEEETIEVAFTAPGDKVLTGKPYKKKGKWKAKLQQVEEDSPFRILPRCAHFTDCGGCKWQHIDYLQQTKFKEEYVKECFKEIIGPDTALHPIIPSEDPWQYRNKMDFSFKQKKTGEKRLGLYAESGKGNVVDLKECHLVGTWYMEALEATRRWWQESDIEAYYPPKDRGSLRTMTIREGKRTGDRMVILNVSGNPDYSLNKQHLESFVAHIRDAVEPLSSDQQFSIFLRIQQSIPGMTTNFYEMVLHGSDSIREILHVQVDKSRPAIPLQFEVGPSSFFQPNTLQAEKLYSIALQMANLPKDAVVYDLYCGTGTLAICIAPYVKEVVGIEISPEAALDARTNVGHNKLDNVTILSGAVRHTLKQIKEDKKHPLPDFVMIDPPRAGLEPAAVEQLISLDCEKILYISCNPQTQADNIKMLLAAGYELESVCPVDQFPHTYHIENIALLKKCSKS